MTTTRLSISLSLGWLYQDELYRGRLYSAKAEYVFSFFSNCVLTSFATSLRLLDSLDSFFDKDHSLFFKTRALITCHEASTRSGVCSGVPRAHPRT